MYVQPRTAEQIYVPYRPDIDEVRQDLSLGTDPHASPSGNGLDPCRGPDHCVGARAVHFLMTSGHGIKPSAPFGLITPSHRARHLDVDGSPR